MSLVVSHVASATPCVVLPSVRCSFWSTAVPVLELYRRTTSTLRPSALSKSITSPATTKGWAWRRCATRVCSRSAAKPALSEMGTRVTTTSLATHSVSSAHASSAKPSAMLVLVTRAPHSASDPDSGAMLTQSICATLTDSCHERALYRVMASPFWPATCRPMQKGKHETSPTHAPLPGPLPTHSGCT